MKTLAGIRGQDAAVRQLRAALQSGQPHHAYLFTGPDGVGKRTAALAFAAAWNCTAGKGDLCGSCISCRKAAGGTHPDIHVVEPTGTSLKIAQVRELQKVIHLTPVEGRYQVAILLRAEDLTAEAANSLLKVLEEPPERTVFILVTTNEQALLPTIISRCQRVGFRPLDQEALTELLAARMPPEQAKKAALLAGGSMAGAEQLLSPGTGKNRDRANRIKERLMARNIADLYQLINEKDFSQKDIEEVLQFLLDDWQVLFRQAVDGTSPSLTDPGWGPELTELDLDRKVQVLEQILETQQLVQQNINAYLALAVLLINIREIIIGGRA